jgi:type IV pilus assembly protein PilN
MARINLRPWREELRAERQQEYLMVLLLVAISALAIWWFVSGALNDGMASQHSRNQYLERQASAMDKKIEEIKELRKKREQLLDRMRLIQDLQGNRPVIVRVFDEFARIMPDDLFLDTVKAEGKQFTIKGRASSNDQISQLMRNFDSSPWFSSPNLLGVSSGDGEFNGFDMLVNKSRPTSDKVK